jgi:tetraprenyl-beta-curcumene synthase
MAAGDQDATPKGAPKVPGALGDRRLVARAGLALVLANVRYWTSVAPIVRSELKRWRLRVQAIDDPELRALALDKLNSEGFHAEAAAMLATIGPRAHRSSVVEAIVALELLFDYLDGLTELPSGDPLREGDRLFEAFRRAVVVPVVGATELVEQPLCDDGGYLEELSRAVSLAIGRLPATPAITEHAQLIASRSGEAQTRMHAVPQLGIAQLEEWARAQPEETDVEWRELVVGAASSVLVLHALIAAAADPRTTSAEADGIANAYRSTCVLLTLLDGVVDRELDKAEDGSDGPGYLSLFGDRDELWAVLGQAARRAATQASRLPNAPHHLMILVGVAAYYGSAPGAEDALARPMVALMREELSPLMSPTLTLMRTWRSMRWRVRSYLREHSLHEFSIRRRSFGAR